MSNTITAFFKGRTGVCESVYQHDYGLVLILDDIDFGTSFDAYFEIMGEDEAIPAVGQNDRVAIPNSCLANSGMVKLHIPVHSGENDSEVEYVVEFKVIGRAKPVDDGTPADQVAITQAIAALQEAKRDIPEDIQSYYDTQIAPNIEGDVNDWLDDHPEATTTVQDHSLTYQKLVSGTLGFVTPQMFGAVGNGIADDTSAINDCLSYASGKALVFIPAGTYLIDGNGTDFYNPPETLGILVKSNTKILLDKGAIIQQKDVATVRSNMISIHNCSNVEICGGQLIGNRDYNHPSDGEWNYGITVTGSTNVFIHDIEISKCWGDGVYIGQPLTAESSGGNYHNSGIVIDNCFIHDVARNGVAVCDAEKWQINNCRFSTISGKAPQSGIDIEVEGDFSPVLSTGEVNNNTFFDCELIIQIWGGDADHIIRGVYGNTRNLLFKNCGKIYVYDCFRTIGADNAEVFVYDSSFSLYPSNGAIIHAYGSKVSSGDNWRDCTIYAYNCIIDLLIYTENSSFYFYNCDIINTISATDKFINTRSSCGEFVMDSCRCIFDAYVNVPLTLNDFSRITVLNCIVEATFEERGSLFDLGSGTTRLMNGNRYAPYANLYFPNASLISGCVNFKY